MDNHKGSPKAKVKIKWEENLKMYGVNPNKLIKIKKINKKEIIRESPFNIILFLRAV
jgi:hypothetical protein